MQKKKKKKFTRRPAAGAGGASAVVVLFVGHCFGTVVVGAATFFWPPNDSWKIRAEERVLKKEWKCKWTGNGLTLHRGGQTRSRLSRYVNDAWGRQCQQPWCCRPASRMELQLNSCVRVWCGWYSFPVRWQKKERKDALLILSRTSRINKLSAYERYVYRYISALKAINI